MLRQPSPNKELSVVSQFCSQFHANSQNAESNLTLSPQGNMAWNSLRSMRPTSRNYKREMRM